MDDVNEEKENIDDETGEPKEEKPEPKTIMEEEQVQNSSAQQIPTTGIYSNQPKGASKLPLIIVGLLILLLIGGATYLIRGKFTEAPQVPSPSPSLETPLIVTSPAPSVDRSKYTLRVLNGTSKSGLAASAAAKLKDLGYKIDKTGNASDSATPQTLVRSKNTLAELVKQLIKDLSPDFDASAGAKLQDSDNVDAEIILGTK